MRTIKLEISRNLAKVFMLVCGVLAGSNIFAQVCSTDPITLSSQADVVGFQAAYGPCNTITANLTISGNDIVDLSPLGLTTVAVPAHLVIQANPQLANLDGLALTSFYWLEVNNNATLTDIDALSTVGSASGPVFVQSNPLLTNVDGLSGLSSIGGALWLQNNASLSDLSGLSAVTSTGGSLVIWNNDALANLDALANVVSVNGMVINDNGMLTSISGLANLGPTSGAVYIRSNPALASLQGLSGLTSVGGLVIDSNASLTNLDALIGLAHIGNITSLALFNNTALTDISGLANVEGVGFNVEVTGNTALTDCSILERLLDDFDDFDPGPGPGTAGIPDVGDDVTIELNAEGCNSLEDIVGSISYSVGGTVSGLGTGSVTLQNNGADDLIVSANGPFVFATALPDGSAYDVTVSAQPADQTCSVANGAGTVQGDDVLGIDVSCEDDVSPPITPPGTAVSVPTLSGWALALLSVSLGLVVIASRKRLL